MTKAALACQLTLEGKLTPREIQKRCGFKHINAVYTACYEKNITPPRSARSRASGTVPIRRRMSKRNGKASIGLYLGVEYLRTAGLQNATEAGVRVVGKEIIVSAK